MNRREPSNFPKATPLGGRLFFLGGCWFFRLLCSQPYYLFDFHQISFLATYFVPPQGDVVSSRQPRSREIKSENCNVWRQQNYSCLTSISPAPTAKKICCESMKRNYWNSVEHHVNDYRKRLKDLHPKRWKHSYKVQIWLVIQWFQEQNAQKLHRFCW